MILDFGLYVHLPYCRSLCPYCAFAKAPLHHAEPGRLLQALRLEWERARAADGTWSHPRTIYWGGGTPTALDPASIHSLLAWLTSAFDLSRLREWTVEANPEGLTDEKLDLLRAGGVGRLSLGVQSLEPAVLRTLGRIHTADQALDALARARRAGFANLSADFIVAVPGETPDGIRRSIEAVVERGVPHLSIYSLQLEGGTPLAAKVARGAMEHPEEERAADRYADLARILGSAGYRHYEVSSWALPGFESRHNQGYWARRPYLGLGPGAHSYDGETRWRNDEDVTRYYERTEAGELPREERTSLTNRAAAEERIMLGLRRSRGLRRAELARLAGKAAEGWSDWAARAGAVRLDPPGRIRPTERGLLLSHEISAELLARMDEPPMGPLDTRRPRC